MGDLPRILRVPSSTNCKIPGQPRPVRLLETSDKRYNPKELEWYLDTIGAPGLMSTVPTETGKAHAIAAAVSGAKLIYDPKCQSPIR